MRAVLAVAALLWLFPVGFAAAQAGSAEHAATPPPPEEGPGLPGPAELFVENPFARPAALDAMRAYLEDLSARSPTPILVPEGFWAAAPRIRRWGYTFAWDPEAGSYDLDFSQTYDAQATADALLRSIGAIKKSGCSYYKAKHPRITGVSLKRLEAKARISGKKRSCGSFLGQEYKTDIADIDGDAEGRVDFRTEAGAANGGRFSGSLVADKPRVDVDVDVTSVVGINVNSVVGKVLYSVAGTTADIFRFSGSPSTRTATDVLNILSNESMRFEDSATLPAEFLAGEDGSISSKRYNDFLSQMRRASWSINDRMAIDDARTGFSRDPAGRILLTLAYHGDLKPYWPVETVYADAAREIALLRSFGEQDQVVAVQPGDTLWALARTHYGNGYFHNLVAGYNGLPRKARNRLRPGQSLVLPPLYKFEMVRGVHFVRPGDTATALCGIWAQEAVPDCLRQLRELNPGVRLAALKVLEPLVMPPPAPDPEGNDVPRGNEVVVDGR